MGLSHASPSLDMFDTPGQLTRKRSSSVLDVYDEFGMRSLLAFVSHRVVRGTPRLFVHLALACLGLLVVSSILPERALEVLFGSTYARAWQRSGVYGSAEVEEEGLRIVVFGENDLLSPSDSTAPWALPPQTWTDVLCEEVGQTFPLIPCALTNTTQCSWPARLSSPSCPTSSLLAGPLFPTLCTPLS
jgi:hypothetical protein